MKVIYKKPILELIDEARTEAVRQRKQIEKIILTTAEFSELREQGSYSHLLGMYSRHHNRHHGLSDIHSTWTTVYGIRVEEEGNKDF